MFVFAGIKKTLQVSKGSLVAVCSESFRTSYVLVGTAFRLALQEARPASIAIGGACESDIIALPHCEVVGLHSQRHGPRSAPESVVE